ncbi:hypothetical protein Pcinc_035283 [Petrolisthes cinctipes]|uniref:Uncharacterized protein n=1 Tax=Petrolisthes cinctipes TaxID=88211 RepID=A0AAE1BX76_PETCI|nr:hypothetical protein Pcinc_035283 [Petrolisthes cinctipes]
MRAFPTSLVSPPPPPTSPTPACCRSGSRGQVRPDTSVLVQITSSIPVATIATNFLHDTPGSNPNMAHSDNLGLQVAIPATLSLSTHNCDHSSRPLRTVIFAPDLPYYPPKQPHLSGSSREPGRQVGSGSGQYSRDSWYLEVG